jgi:hypothetical protein
MAEPNLAQLDRIFLRSHPVIKEAWVQKQLAEKPKLLGLGDLVLKDKERMQAKAGRLDLLYADAENTRRYEVEVQLGKTDESHIIRTIEYWDIERKRYPQYEHVAVIVAEEITARFLNVIHLFNGHIPLIALQLAAYPVGPDYALILTKVLDERKFGVEEESTNNQLRTDRAFWQSKSPDTVAVADAMLTLTKGVEPAYELSYLKGYIGLTRNGVPDNLLYVEPRKTGAMVALALERTDELDHLFDVAGIELQRYDTEYGRYRIRTTLEEVDQKAVVFADMIERALAEWSKA